MYDVAISWKAVYQIINNINIINMLLIISEQDYLCFFLAFIGLYFLPFFFCRKHAFYNNKKQ